MSDFNLAINTILSHEGGYTNDPKDTGNWTGGRIQSGLLKGTKFGISAASYPSLDIRSLTMEDAILIYKRDWWDKYKYGIINAQDVSTRVFDMAVNMGAKAAHKIIQNCVNNLVPFVRQLVMDGILGPASFNEINSIPSCTLMVAIRLHQAAYYEAIVARDPSKARFLKGWLIRAQS